MIQKQPLGLCVRWAGVLAIGLSLGCGNDAYTTASVTGRVMCNGKPAAGGSIILQPIDMPDKTGRPAGSPGWPARGRVQDDGTYVLSYTSENGQRELTGALTGPHRVIFIAPPTEAPKWDPANDSFPEEDQKKIRDQIANFKTYPPLACGTEISPGEVDIQPGTNKLDFELQGKQARPARAIPAGSD